MNSSDTAEGVQVVASSLGMTTDQFEDRLDKVLERRERQRSHDNGSKVPQWFVRIAFGLLSFIIISWVGWVTYECLAGANFRGQGSRYTAQDAAASMSELKSELPTMIRRVLEEPMQQTRKNTDAIKELREMFIRIETKLDVAISHNIQ